MIFDTYHCPWETAANDMQECVSLLDYMDNYEVGFTSRTQETLFFRVLQLAVELLEASKPEQLAAARVDLTRLCCRRYH
ncbi:hypothetical protein EDF56_103531 [Novosphingobium sp. PhB165]|nr:hypothetical protein EDF56_103531 [Novosphingobium sp. PhB165]